MNCCLLADGAEINDSAQSPNIHSAEQCPSPQLLSESNNGQKKKKSKMTRQKKKKLLLLLRAARAKRKANIRSRKRMRQAMSKQRKSGGPESRRQLMLRQIRQK